MTCKGFLSSILKTRKNPITRKLGTFRVILEERSGAMPNADPIRDNYLIA